MTLTPGTLVSTPNDGMLLLLEPFVGTKGGQYKEPMWRCYLLDKMYVFSDFESWILTRCQVVE